MRTILVILLLGLAGCSTAPVQTEDIKAACLKAHSAQYCQIQGWTLETYAYLDGLNVTIKNNAEGGVWTKSQAQDWLDRSKSVRQATDAVTGALAGGDVTNAANLQQIALQALLKLQIEASKVRAQ